MTDDLAATIERLDTPEFFTALAAELEECRRRVAAIERCGRVTWEHLQKEVR